MSGKITRRELMVGVGASAALSVSAAPPRVAKRSLRLAHFTDIHVQPELRAGEGMRAALAHVEAQSDRPDLIVTGGDLIMDAFGAGFDRTKTQWDLFSRVLADGTDLPVEHVIGNHDVWGWSTREANPVEEAKAGKKWAMEVLGLTKPYRSFDRAGWHIVVLDSTHPAPQGGGYTARLDEDQFDWLAEDLARTPASTSILVVSHIPILCAAAYFDGDNEKSGDWRVPGAWMHIDARRIKDLFRKHPNVRACLSGHIHLVDRVDYNGVSYFCNGAVCGGWWRGNYQECEPGYALVDLFQDGTVACRYVSWGWKS